MPAYVYDKKSNELVKVAGNAVKADLKDMNVYSTEEKIVGTWIDGKPIYRRVLKATSNSISIADNWIPIQGISDTFAAIKNQIETVKNVSCVADISSVALGRIEMRLTDGYFEVMVSGGGTTVNNFSVILEYTKTTD